MGHPKDIQMITNNGNENEQDIPVNADSTPNNSKRKWRCFLPTVEPMVFLLMFTSPLSGSVGFFLMMERHCTGECTVEQNKYLAQLSMYSSLLSAIVPALGALFIGSWGDKYGRRPIFVWCFFSNTITYVVYAIMASIPTVSAEWFLVPALLSTFSGGVYNIMGIANSFIADITVPEDKALRLGVLDASQYLGTMLGSGLAAPLTTALRYNGIYILVAACMLLCFLYSLFLLRESKVPAEHPEGESCGCCGGIFRPHLALEALKTCFKKRPHNGRASLVIVIMVVFTGILTMTGESVVTSAFFTEKFDWKAQDQQLYTFYNNGLMAVGTLVGVLVFVKWLDLPDVAIAGITFSCKLGGYILNSISPTSAYMYIGGAVSCFGGMIWVLARTMIVKAVHKDEVGQVFAGAITVEAFCPLIASPLYNLIYTSTVETFPGAFYLVSAAIIVVDFFAILVAVYITRGSRNQQSRGDAEDAVVDG